MTVFIISYVDNDTKLTILFVSYGEAKGNPKIGIELVSHTLDIGT